VLDIDECMTHPLAAARNIFVPRDGAKQPAPAPRFSRTPGQIRGAPVDPRNDTRDALLHWGLSESRIGELAAAGVIAPR
jgi:alpha-methylacyl-CoA racemase